MDAQDRCSDKTLFFYVNPTRTLPNLGEGDLDRARIFKSNGYSNEPVNKRIYVK